MTNEETITLINDHTREFVLDESSVEDSIQIMTKVYKWADEAIEFALKGENNV